jgi:hypothetical protein
VAVWDPWESVAQASGQILGASGHAGRADSRLTGKWHCQADVTLLALEQGKTLIGVSTQEELVEYLLYIWSQGAMGGPISFLIMAKEAVQVVGHNPPERTQKGVPSPISAGRLRTNGCGGCSGQSPSDLQELVRHSCRLVRDQPDGFALSTCYLAVNKMYLVA